MEAQEKDRILKGALELAKVRHLAGYAIADYAPDTQGYLSPFALRIRPRSLSCWGASSTMVAQPFRLAKRCLPRPQTIPILVIQDGSRPA
jgi:hypothetical protein